MIKKAIIKYKELCVAIVLFGIIISLTSVLSIVFFQRLIDAITQSLQQQSSPNLTLDTIMEPLILYSICMLSDCIFNYLDEYPLVKLTNSLYQYFKISAVKKVSTIDYQLYQQFGTGQIIQIVENGANAGKDIIMSFYVSNITRQIPKILFSLVFLGSYNIKIMAIICVGYIFVFIVTQILLKKLYSIKNEALICQETMNKRFVRCLMETVIFRINRVYTKEIKELEKDAGKITSNITKIRLIHEAFFTIFYLIIIIIKIIIIVLSVLFADNITIGAIVAMTCLIDNIYNPIAQFNVAYVEFKLNKIALKRFEDFMDLPVDNNLLGGEPLKDINGRICVDNVSFFYDKKQVLSNISFEVKPNSSFALVGESGCGKSTITKLIMGLIKYNDGEILIDDIALDKINLKSFYKYVTYITQDAPVFDATIRENIIFDKNICDEEIYRVLEFVKLEEYIKRQPNGLDTQIGEKGLKLSGGEKQRLALARAYFDNSKIVILDEATSAMDNVTEEFVMDNLYKKLFLKTIIVITHRLNTVKNADMICVIKKGKVVEKGTFEELTKQNDGYFYALSQNQNIGIN